MARFSGRSPAHGPARRLISFLAAVALTAAAGCDQLTTILGEYLAAQQPKKAAIALISPTQDADLRVGATVRIEWADVAYQSPTTIRVEALRLADNGSVAETFVLVDGRDAFADGSADFVDFDTTGRPTGVYQFRVTLTAPDQDPIVITSDALIGVT